MIRGLGIRILLLLLLTGCVKENMDECPEGNVALSLKYTLNIANENQFEDKVGRIDLYVFDNLTGLLVRMEPVDRKRIIGGVYRFDLPPGNYTIVGWGVSGGSIAEGGYSPVEMMDLVNDTHITPLVGRTTKDDFRLRLNTVLTDEGHKTAAMENFDELYHGVVEHIEVSEQQKQQAELLFTKNTNLFKIRVEGLENLAPARREASQIELFVVGTDDRYNHLNMACTPDKGLLYPVKRSPESDISVLRLNMELHKTQPVKLHMRRADTGAEMMAPIDLLDLILKLKDEDGNLKFKTQQDLDRWDEFEIQLRVKGDLSVAVEVKGFIINDTEGELG